MAQLEVRAHLPRRLRQWDRVAPGAGSLLSVLQSPAPAPGARLRHAGRPVSAPVNKEKVITMMGGATPHAPRDLTLFSSRVDDFALVVFSDCRTIVELDRRIGQRRDATRAPTQARSGWRPSGRLLVSPLHHLRTVEILSKRWGTPRCLQYHSPPATSCIYGASTSITLFREEPYFYGIPVIDGGLENEASARRCP